jgi:hypothetical protein
LTNKELYHFFKNVTTRIGYYDWKINFCRDNYCWHNSKVINVDPNYDGDIRQIILHEIAHINTAKYCNQKHNPQFWKRLKDLNRKFLKQDLDDNQKRHMEYMSSGYYSLIYKD